MDAQSSSQSGSAQASQFAVIKFSGKQFRVRSGQRISVDRVKGNPGDSLTINDVLLIGSSDADIQVGAPTLDGASVQAKILSHRQDKKVRIFKKKRRTGYTKRQGHRQQLTDLMIEGIVSPR